jgi:hypothetical protein
MLHRVALGDRVISRWCLLLLRSPPSRWLGGLWLHWSTREDCAVLWRRICVGYQQNRVPHFHRKNYPPRQNNGSRPTTASLGLTLLKTKAKGQALEPPSAPPLRLTSVRLARPPWRHLGAWALWRYRGARPFAWLLLRSISTVTHCHRYARALTLSC